jgi:hypothetical protein
MSEGYLNMYGDLACSLVMMVCGCWLLTDQHLGRLLRVCHALIAAGALVNVLGIVADRVGFHDISYGYIWPGEVIANLGTAVLLAAWAWRSMRRRRDRAAVFPSSSG